MVKEGELRRRVPKVQIQRRGAEGSVRPPVRGGGLDGAAAGRGVGGAGEIGLGLGATEAERGGVVGMGGLLGGVEGTEPDAALPRRVADLRRVTPPRPLADAAELRPLLSSAAASGLVVGNLRANWSHRSTICVERGKDWTMRCREEKARGNIKREERSLMRKEGRQARGGGRTV